MRIKMLAVAAAVVLAGGLGDIFVNTTAHADTVITYTEHLTNEQWVFFDGTTAFHPTGPPSPGDRNFLRFDIMQNGAIVGFANVTCTFIFNGNAQCIGVNAFTGRGDLLLTGLVRSNGQGPPAVFDLIVSGGTFEFNGVRGSAHIEATSPGNETTTLHLV